jgi:4-amino-4-deoxychorismate lyase
MIDNYDYVLVNGEQQSSVNCNDRGLAYGDGIFETIRLNQGQITFHNLHFTRLYRGCDILNIRLSKRLLQDDIATLLANTSATTDGILKIIITRGYGLGGYTPEQNIPPNRILLHKKISQQYKNKTATGAVVGLSDIILYPSCVADTKHLNRLPQVMASYESQQKNFNELLLANQYGNIIEGTCSNLFLVNNQNELITPNIYNYGVAGVCREWIIQNQHLLKLTVKLKDCTITDLQQAKEIFLCNSVFGVWPIVSFNGTAYAKTSISNHIKDVIDNELCY